MTRDQRASLSVFFSLLDREIRSLETAPARAAELSKGFDEMSAIAVRAGMYDALVGDGAKTMRRLLEHLRSSFPKVAPL